jgi:hypothetical protein
VRLTPIILVPKTVTGRDRALRARRERHGDADGLGRTRAIPPGVTVADWSAAAVAYRATRSMPTPRPVTITGLGVLNCPHTVAPDDDGNGRAFALER